MVRVVVFAGVVLAGCGGLVQAQGTTDDGDDSGSTSGAPADASSAASTATPDDTTSGASGTSDDGGVIDDATSGASSGDGPNDDTSSSSGAGSETTAGESSGGVPATCGDGRRDEGEDCDDANRSEIDGCTSQCEIGPTGLSFGAASTTDEGGGNGANIVPFSDDCPAGQVLTGLTGRLTSQGLGPAVVLGRVQGECSSLSLVNSDPTAIASAPGASLIEHGGFQEGGDWALECPEGAVVTAFEGRAGSIIDSLEITCTPLQIAGTGGMQALELGPPTTEGPAGGMGGGPFGPIDCPAGEIAAGLAGDTNSYVIRLALRCREAALDYP